MDLKDSPEEAAIRAEVRSWLVAHAQPRVEAGALATGSSPQAAAVADRLAEAREWQRTLFDGGWAGITFPTEYGGRDGTAAQQLIFNEEQAKFDVTAGPLSIAIQMVVPTLLAHGTAEQKANHVSPILRGEEVWCQLFSEPGSGSDLASLGTRAVQDGDSYVISGQKVWNSFAQFADYGILLARTNPDVPKHAGITYFIVRIDSPGIEVRPLRQITGIAHFNEVFLTDVRVPVENVVGPLHGGWSVAQTTLGNERAMIGGGSNDLRRELFSLAKRRGVHEDKTIRQGLAAAYARISVLEYLGYRLRTALLKGTTPGAEASVLKLAYSKHMASTGDLVMAILGADGMLWGNDAIDHARWQDYFLSQYTVRLGGGTDEIQHNLIAERALGMPREPITDRGIPWRDLVKA
jgi:alkylation response protein AidB-like acyl-CoA dehydrogenase